MRQLILLIGHPARDAVGPHAIAVNRFGSPIGLQSLLQDRDMVDSSNMGK